MIEHDDKELDDLIRRFGGDYNAPPTNPPLDSIRERVHASRSSRRKTVRWMWTGAIAAGFALLAIGLSRPSLLQMVNQQRAPIADSSLHAARNALEESTRQANEIMNNALDQAESAAKAHPNDPFYRQHLDAMRSNALHFHELQQSRSTRGAI